MARRRLWVLSVGLTSGAALCGFRYKRLTPRHLVFDLDQAIIVSKRYARRHPKEQLHVGSSAVATPELCSTSRADSSSPTAPVFSKSNKHAAGSKDQKKKADGADDAPEFPALWRVPDLKMTGHNYNVWKRPHSAWALGIFKRMGLTVSLYTAAKKTYADEITDALFPGLFPPNARLYRGDCVNVRGHGKDLRRSVTALANAGKVCCISRSEAVTSSPDADECVTRELGYVILVDDRASNRVGNQNFRCVPAYTSPGVPDREMIKLVGFVVATYIIGLPDPAYVSPFASLSPWFEGLSSRFS